MGKAHQPGVEAKPAYAPAGRELSRSFVAVHVVTEHGTADVREVSAHLVRTAALEPRLHERGLPPALTYAHLRSRREEAATGAHPHPVGAPARPPYRLVDAED